MLSDVAERMAAIIAKSVRRSAAHAALLLAFKRKRLPPAVNVTPLFAALMSTYFLNEAPRL